MKEIEKLNIAKSLELFEEATKLVSRRGSGRQKTGRFYPGRIPDLQLNMAKAAESPTLMERIH